MSLSSEFHRGWPTVGECQAPKEHIGSVCISVHVYHGSMFFLFVVVAIFSYYLSKYYHMYFINYEMLTLITPLNSLNHILILKNEHTFILLRQAFLKSKLLLRLTILTDELTIISKAVDSFSCFCHITHITWAQEQKQCKLLCYINTIVLNK